MRCDCVEPWATTPGRYTLPVLSDDPGEQVLHGIETASGLRAHGCPWRQSQHPFVVRVVRAHRWWKASQLEARFGGRVPEAIARGIEVYDGALNGISVYDAREEREERRRKAELDRQNGPVRGPTPGGRRRR